MDSGSYDTRHQDARARRRPGRRHAAGPAGAAGHGLPELAHRRARAGADHGRSLHQAQPVEPGARLRAVPARHRQLQRQPGPARHHRAARSSPNATSRPRATPTRPSSNWSTQFPESRYTPDARAAHGLHRQFAGRVRGPRGALLLPPRRLCGGRQPRPAGGHGVPAGAQRRRSAVHPGAELRQAGADDRCATTPSACCARISRTADSCRRACWLRRSPGGSSGDGATGAAAQCGRPPARPTTSSASSSSSSRPIGGSAASRRRP